MSTEGLHPVTIRPSILRYVRQLLDRRFFIWADARFKALRSTRDYRLWRLWLVLNPFLDVALYGFLFGYLFKTSRGIDNFIGFLIIGIIFMRMITGMFTGGTNLLKASRGMITAFQFPRATLVFSRGLRMMIDNLLPAAVAIIMGLAFQYQKPVSWKLILVVPLFFLVHVFGAGLLLITSRATAVIPDLRAVINVLSQAWFFLSGVMFDISRFDAHPKIQEFMAANPCYIFLNAIRDVILYDTIPALKTWLILIAWSVTVFLLGFIYFWQAEERYTRLV